MKAAVIEEPGKLILKDVPEPVSDDYQCLVEILYCSTCSGSEQKTIQGKYPKLKSYTMIYPGILGHESVGRIIKVSKKVKNYREGDLVLRPTSVYPGDKLGPYSSNLGAYAELGLVTDIKALIEDKGASPYPMIKTNYCYLQQVLPDFINPVDAPILIMFKEVLGWLQKFEVKPNSSVFIAGSGPVGLTFVKFTKILGCKPVIVCNHDTRRLNLAEKLGADFKIKFDSQNVLKEVREITDGKGVNYYIEAVGDSSLINQGINLISVNGKIGVYGLSSDSSFNIEWTNAPWSWSIHFIDGNKEFGAHEQIIDAVKLGLENPKDFYDMVMPFEQINEVFQLIAQRRVMKVVVKIKK